MDFRPNLIPYNHAYYINEDLREEPRDPREFYMSILWLEEMSKRIDFYNRAKALSYLAVLYRISGCHEDAYETVHEAIHFFRYMKRPVPYSTFIRLAQVLQASGDFTSADLLYVELIKELEEDVKKASKLVDFAYQHYGKSLYEQGKYESAAYYFKKALAIRIEKNNYELIRSTMKALSCVGLKLNN